MNVTIRLDDQVSMLLQAEVERRGTTAAGLIRHIVTKYLSGDDVDQSQLLKQIRSLSIRSLASSIAAMDEEEKAEAEKIATRISQQLSESG